MAHLVESMAYVGDTPWHGLGNRLSAHQPLQTWLVEAGMDWHIAQSDVLFNVASDGLHIRPHTDAKVLYRSDTLAPLSVVSNRYKVVQPDEVLGFYKDLVKAGGFELETAGVLKGGRKLWALARTGQESALRGGDTVKAYLLLATSCDGSLCTTAQFTSVRVVCNNTLAIALQGASAGAIKVPHSTHFDAQAVKRQLGIAVNQWDSFMYRMKTLAERKVKTHEAMNYFLKVICQTDQQGEGGGSGVPGLANERALKKVQTLFEGHGRGAELQAAKDTAWGLLSAVTEFVDHEKQARSQDNRLDSAWFGQGAALKQRALEHALQLVA